MVRTKQTARPVPHFWLLVSHYTDTLPYVFSLALAFLIVIKNTYIAGKSMQNEKIQQCQEQLEALLKTMAAPLQQALKEAELEEANARAETILAKSVKDHRTEAVHANTTAMEKHMVALDTTMVCLKTSISTTNMQQKASEHQRKQASEELSVSHGTVSNVARDVGNAMQIMESLFCRVQDLNAKRLQLKNNASLLLFRQVRLTCSNISFTFQLIGIVTCTHFYSVISSCIAFV